MRQLIVALILGIVAVAVPTSQTFADSTSPGTTADGGHKCHHRHHHHHHHHHHHSASSGGSNGG